MKYALISEEQIKQLRDAIYAPLNKDALAVLNARAIIKSLKPSEPVAWITRRNGFGGVVLSGYETCEPTDYDATPVYTATPIKPWVGLTDETLDDVYFCVEGGTTPLETWREQARAIEAKLKEKNG